MLAAEESLASRVDRDVGVFQQSSALFLDHELFRKSLKGGGTKENSNAINVEGATATLLVIMFHRCYY